MIDRYTSLFKNSRHFVVGNETLATALKAVLVSRSVAVNKVSGIFEQTIFGLHPMSRLPEV